MYDLIIAGAGPAGLSAAIYAKRAELNVVVIERAPMCGGQIINTYDVDNYPGLPGISGFDLAVKFQEHCEKLEIPFLEGEITKAGLTGDVKKLLLADNRELSAKAVILATGAVSRKLNVPGEEQFTGSGVSYCATCDGAFFRNKTVAVVGGGDVAAEDAIFLARLCKKVYVIHRRNEFRAAKTLVSALSKIENVEFVLCHTVEEIYGDSKVESILVKNTENGAENKIQVEGVFIAVGTVPNTQIFQDCGIEMDKNGYLKAGEDTKTNLPGIFAAGDVRTKRLRQVVTAAADGACAVLAVEEYLNSICF